MKQHPPERAFDLPRTALLVFVEEYDDAHVRRLFNKFWKALERRDRATKRRRQTYWDNTAERLEDRIQELVWRRMTEAERIYYHHKTTRNFFETCQRLSRVSDQVVDAMVTIAQTGRELGKAFAVTDFSFTQPLKPGMSTEDVLSQIEDMTITLRSKDDEQNDI